MLPTDQYIFFDESGKPEVYSSKGVNLVIGGTATKFLVLAAVRCNDQLALQQQITEFRLKLLKDSSLISIFSPSYSLDSFHAQTDYLEVKNRFFEFINKLDIIINVIVVDKLKCYPALQQDPEKMYGVMAGQLLRDLLHQYPNSEVIFSRKDSKLKLRKALEIEVERSRLEFIHEHPRLGTNITLNYFHNPHYTHGGLQVADYVSHAIFQVYENNKRDFYELIKDKISSIHDICNKVTYAKRAKSRYI